MVKRCVSTRYYRLASNAAMDRRQGVKGKRWAVSKQNAIPTAIKLESFDRIGNRN